MITVERLTWILERIFYYSLMLILLASVIFSLSQDYSVTALISFILFLIVLYKGLICVHIRANSLVLREGKVVFLIPEKTVRNRFDFVSRGQTIFALPYYNLLDHPYRLEIVSPDNKGGVYACRLSLKLGYDTELTALQHAYDSVLLHQEWLHLEVNRLLLNCLDSLRCPPFSAHNEETGEDNLKPLVAELNLGLESVGLKVVEVNRSFFTGPTLVRLVADEQAMFDKEQ